MLDDCSSTYFAGFVQDDWRVTPAAHAQPRPALRARHQRQEHLGLRRHQPDRAPFYQGDRRRDLNNFGPRIGFAWTNTRGALPAPRRLRASTTTASRSRSCRSSAASTAARCRSRCAPATSSSSIPRPGTRAAVRADLRQPLHRLHPARRRRLGHQHHRQHAREPDRAAVQPRDALQAAGRRRAAARPRPQPRHALHHRPADRRGLQSRWWAAPTAS